MKAEYNKTRQLTITTITKPPRTEPIKQLSNISIPANNTYSFILDDSNTDEYSAVVIVIKVSYDTSATKGIRVRWLYSPDGVNFDDIEDAEDAGNYEDLVFSAGDVCQRTILIPIFQPYIKIQIVNMDTDYAVIVDAWRLQMR